MIKQSVLACGLGLVLSAAASAQTVTTVLSNGPSSELYDIVILGDGYTAAQQTEFNNDVAAVVAYFQNTPRLFPYDDYFQIYNVHSVFRASVQDGADKPSACYANPYNRNTVYDAEYCWGGTQRCVYIRNTGTAAADAALAPDTDGRVIVLVNDDEYGGCASTYSVSYNGSSMEEVQMHEWGHSFGLLADEYDYGQTGPYAGPEPSAVNCTRSTTGNGKWPAWVGFSGEYGTVGAYAGACYYPPTPTPTLYRPEPDCEMRNLNRRFCTICKEQLIKRAHAEVDMIDNPFRSGGTVTQHETLLFSFTNRIANRPHTIEWRVDAGPWVSGTRLFYWNVGSTSLGAHSVTLRLTDTSPEVRNDPSNLLVHTFLWNFTVNSGDLIPRCTTDEVLPSSEEYIESGSASGFPFGQTSGEMRTMYAYGPTTLGVNGPVRFGGIAFRPDGSASSLTAGSYDMKVYISTSRNPATNLNRTFEANHGADKILAFNTTVTVPAQTLGTAEHPFLLKINFLRDFEWDPNFGPLLVDMQLEGVAGRAASTWDGVFNSGDDVGRIVHTTDANASTANFGSGTQNFALTMALCEDCEVGPDAYEFTEANSASSYPWNTGPNRTLQMYGAGEFESDFDGRHRITKLAFRPDGGRAMAGFSYRMTVDISTGSGPASTPNANFNANHGSDRQRVFSGILNVEAQAASSNPAGFGVEVPLDRAFEYNPSDGPLVVDIRVTAGSGAPGTTFDGPFNTGEDIGRLFSSNPDATSASPQNFGLVMCVVSEPCPTLPEVNDTSFDSASGFPWNSSGPQRAMYAYDRNALASLKPQYIQHLRWRPNASATSIGPVTYDVRVDLSTSRLSSASALTTNFSSNHGRDVRTVFNGNVSIPYTPLSGDPREFPLSIQLDEPFFWNPLAGPLIVDIRSDGILGGGNTTTFDGEFNGVTYRVVHRSNQNAATADFGPQAFGYTLSICGEDCNGQAISYGAACAGSGGTSVNTTIGLPTIPNPNFAYRLLNGPANQPAALWIGTNQISLPLTGIGATGCFILNNINIASVGTATNGSGVATLNSPIPLDPLIDGAQVFTQWIAIDPGASRPLRIITSDGQRIRLCF